MFKGKGWLWVFFSFFFITMLLVGWTGQVQSQEKYPTRAIDVICPFAPGGATDIYARFAAEFLKKKVGCAHQRDQQDGWQYHPSQCRII